MCMKTIKQIHAKSTSKANLGVDLLSTQGIRDIDPIIYIY